MSATNRRRPLKAMALWGSSFGFASIFPISSGVAFSSFSPSWRIVLEDQRLGAGEIVRAVDVGVERDASAHRQAAGLLHHAGAEVLERERDLRVVSRSGSVIVLVTR